MITRLDILLDKMSLFRFLIWSEKEEENDWDRGKYIVCVLCAQPQHQFQTISVARSYFLIFFSKIPILFWFLPICHDFSNKKSKTFCNVVAQLFRLLNFFETDSRGSLKQSTLETECFWTVNFGSLFIMLYYERQGDWSKFKNIFLRLLTWFSLQWKIQLFT